MARVNKEMIRTKRTFEIENGLIFDSVSKEIMKSFSRRSYEMYNRYDRSFVIKINLTNLEVIALVEVIKNLGYCVETSKDLLTITVKESTEARKERESLKALKEKYNGYKAEKGEETKFKTTDLNDGNGKLLLVVNYNKIAGKTLVQIVRVSDGKELLSVGRCRPVDGLKDAEDVAIEMLNEEEQPTTEQPTTAENDDFITEYRIVCDCVMTHNSDGTRTEKKAVSPWISGACIYHKIFLDLERAKERLKIVEKEAEAFDERTQAKTESWAIKYYQSNFRIVSRKVSEWK